MAAKDYAALIGASAVVFLILIAFLVSRFFGEKKSGESRDYYLQFELPAKTKSASNIQSWTRRPRTRKSTRSNKK